MKLILNNNIDELNRMISAIEEFCEKNEIGLKDTMNISLVLEEIFTNVVFYAFEDKDSHDIEVNLNIVGKEIIMEICDDGSEFNILDKPEPDDLEKEAEDRNVGGLGIHFVKKLMDEIKYKRAGNRNILHLKKKIENK